MTEYVWLMSVSWRASASPRIFISQGVLYGRKYVGTWDCVAGLRGGRCT